jgi:hypothetical protein
LQEFPISQQFRMMDLGPSLNKALLCPRKLAANAFDWVQRERGQCVLIQRMEMRPMVRGPTSMNIRMTIPKNRDSSGTAILYIVGTSVFISSGQQVLK